MINGERRGLSLVEKEGHIFDWGVKEEVKTGRKWRIQNLEKKKWPQVFGRWFSNAEGRTFFPQK